MKAASKYGRKWPKFCPCFVQHKRLFYKFR